MIITSNETGVFVKRNFDQGIYAISWFPNDDRFLTVACKDTPIDLTYNSGAGSIRSSLERDSSAFDMYSYDANDYNRELLYKNEEGLELADIS